jgi:hypothetical protein
MRAWTIIARNEGIGQRGNGERVGELFPSFLGVRFNV